MWNRRPSGTSIKLSRCLRQQEKVTLIKHTYLHAKLPQTKSATAPKHTWGVAEAAAGYGAHGMAVIMTYVSNTTATSMMRQTVVS